jgi:hypothetical protein
MHMATVDQIDYSRLDRLRRESRSASAIATGLMGQLMECQQHIARVRGTLTSAEGRLSSWTRGSPRPNQTRQEFDDEQQALMDWRAAQMRHLKAVLRAGNATTSAGFTQAAAEINRLEQSDFLPAVVIAQHQLDQALEEERDVAAAHSAAARRSAALKQSAEVAEKWLSDNRLPLAEPVSGGRRIAA